MQPNRALGSTALAWWLSVHLVSAAAKDIDQTYTMALPAGLAKVDVTNREIPFDVKAFLLVTTDKDYLGKVTIDKLSMVTTGTQTSATAYYDVELYATDKVLPLTTQQFPAGQNATLFNSVQAPVRYLSVYHNLLPGAYATSACFDFVANLPCVPTDLIKVSERKLLSTEANGLSLAIYDWSGRPVTAFDASSIAISVKGKIDNYQITPGLMKKTPIGVPSGDTAYNAGNYLNDLSFAIDGNFTNRASAKFVNNGALEVNGAFANEGHLVHLVDVNLINVNGTIGNAPTGVMDIGGWIYVGASSGTGSLNNAGTVNLVDGGDLTISSVGTLGNIGQINLHGQASQVNMKGHLLNSAAGTITINQGTFKTFKGSNSTNTGVIKTLPNGVLVNEGALSSTGEIDNSGTMVNARSLEIIQSRLGNQGSLQNLTGATMTLQSAALESLGSISNAGVFRLTASTANNFAGSQFSNSGKVFLEDQSTFINSGRFVNVKGGTLTVFLQGSVLNEGVFVNSAGASFSNAANSTVVNTGSFANAGGTVVVNGDFYSTGAYTQNGGSLTVNGTMFGNLVLDGGTLTGRNRIAGNVVARNVTIEPGGTGGLAPLRVQLAARIDVGAVPQEGATATLTVDGDLTLADSIINIRLGAAEHDTLSVNGIADINNTQVRFVVLPGSWQALQTTGANFHWLDAANVPASTWSGLDYDIGEIGADGTWAPMALADGVKVDFSEGNFTLTGVVPEPPPGSLLLAGLTGLVGWLRLRSPRQQVDAG